MRVVIDTNVLVSGTINPHGSPGRVVDAIISAALTVLYDDRIIAEYREVLRRPAFGFERGDVETLLDFIELSGEPVVVQPLAVVLPDATDLPFLEVAASGHAAGLVTGNVKHFTLRRGTHAVKIYRPAQFIQLLKPPTSP